MSETFPPPPPPFSPYQPTQSNLPDPGLNVLDKLKIPAILLIVTASISCLNSLWGLLMSGSSLEQMQQLLEQTGQSEQLGPLLTSITGGVGTVINLAFLALYALCLTGGIKMLKAQSYGLVLTACIISSIPCIGSSCCIGMVPGIWGLVLLLKPEIKEAFR
jgi:hypothetical protein